MSGRSILLQAMHRGPAISHSQGNEVVHRYRAQRDRCGHRDATMILDVAACGRRKCARRDGTSLILCGGCCTRRVKTEAVGATTGRQRVAATVPPFVSRRSPKRTGCSAVVVMAPSHPNALLALPRRLLKGVAARATALSVYRLSNCLCADRLPRRLCLGARPL